MLGTQQRLVYQLTPAGKVSTRQLLEPYSWSLMEWPNTPSHCLAVGLLLSCLAPTKYSGTGLASRHCMGVNNCTCNCILQAHDFVLMTMHL
jgi:hypothetical protein